MRELCGKTVRDRWRNSEDVLEYKKYSCLLQQVTENWFYSPSHCCHCPESLLTFRKGYRIACRVTQLWVDFGEISWNVLLMKSAFSRLCLISGKENLSCRKANWKRFSIRTWPVIDETKQWKDSRARYESANGKQWNTINCFYTTLWLRHFSKVSSVHAVYRYACKIK